MSDPHRSSAHRPSQLWVSRLGLLAATISVGLAWWFTAHAPNAVLVDASGAATLALIVGYLGHRAHRGVLLVAGLLLAGLAAPTGFGYLGNLVAIIAGLYLAASAIGTHRSRTRATS